ncbi:MAG: GIY-YIG nuclease family protein [Candidatus Paceibacterota bacterium]
MDQHYYFYLLRCSDGSLYAGICIDLEQRVKTHQNGKGAKYTRSRLPVTLEYQEDHPSKGDALRRELEVKKWTKQRKERLVRDGE